MTEGSENKVIEVHLSALIYTRSLGHKAVEAWARTEDAALICHRDGKETDVWSITHRPTGLAVRPSRSPTKQDALALIDAYLPLADWSAIKKGETDPEAMNRLRHKVEAVYEQFEWPSFRTGQNEIDG